MNIVEITDHKTRLMDILRLADDQENLIAAYLARGALFALHDHGGIKAAAVVTDEGDGVCALKNIATVEACRAQGYGSALLHDLCGHYRPRFDSMIVGTGESPRLLRFYQRHGFVFSHRLPGFFTEHYEHPVRDENGRLLRDMIVLKKDLQAL